MDVIVYGTGDYGCKFLSQYENTHNILFWVDGNEAKQGTLFFNRKIMSPDTIERYKDTPIVIAIRDDFEVRLALLSMGCSDIWKFIPEQGLRKVDGKEEKYYKEASCSYWSNTHDVLEFDAPYSCTSQICNQGFFDAPFFQYWSKKFMPNFFDHLKLNSCMSKTENTYNQPIIYHRKLWEWVYISQALYERGCLDKGKKGVAFGVGEECSPDLYASFGCEILATDLGNDQAMAKGWMKEGQNAGGDISKFHKYNFCTSSEFEKRVSYRDVDMNNIPSDIQGFDFCWSACALEHLGSLQKGLDFIKSSLNVLKSGGIAVHTTEFNLTSNEETMETDGLSIYRRCDIEKVVKDLESEGHYVYPVNWYIGNGVVDYFVDFPPYLKKDMHLRLRLAEYSCTSIGLIIKKR